MVDEYQNWLINTWLNVRLRKENTVFFNTPPPTGRKEKRNG
jgi:hypothetical protein